MYTEQELQTVCSMKKKRLWVALLPAALLFAAAIAVFVVGQLRRSDSLWKLTAALTLLGGVYALFLYGVYVKPVLFYQRHVDSMLHGRKHETVGVLKEFGDQLKSKNGVDCYPVTINIGEKNDGKDDRLYYFDAKKEWPNPPLGSRLTIISNDMMVADYRLE